MYHILKYSRLKNTSVRNISNNSLESICYLKDSFQEAEVKIVVQLPDLEIKKVKANLIIEGENRYIPKEQLNRILNVRIGPGIFKIIKGTIKIEHKQILSMLEECCRGIILSFTKEDLLRSPRPEDDEAAIEYYANMLKENVRLYDRCAAFAPGSRIVKYIKAKGQHVKIHEK